MLHVLDGLVDREWTGAISRSQIEDGFFLIIYVDWMVARLDHDLANVFAVDLVEVDGEEGGGGRFAEITADELLEVHLEAVAVWLPERAVVGGQSDGGSGRRRLR